jgi:hypothetical protein
MLGNGKSKCKKTAVKTSFLLGEASVILRSSRNSRLFFVVACCKRR